MRVTEITFKTFERRPKKRTFQWGILADLRGTEIRTDEQDYHLKKGETVWVTDMKSKHKTLAAQKHKKVHHRNEL